MSILGRFPRKHSEEEILLKEISWGSTSPLNTYEVIKETGSDREMSWAMMEARERPQLIPQGALELGCPAKPLELERGGWAFILLL